MAQVTTAIASSLATNFPIALKVEYRLLNGAKPRTGQTVSLSRNVIVIRMDERLPIGERIELLIAWPVALNGSIRLRLWVIGTIVETQRQRTTVKIGRFEFRTRGLVRCRPDAANRKE